MKLTIEMDCNNDAFQNAMTNEIRHVLNYAILDLAHDIEENGEDVIVHMQLTDSNGNNVGWLSWV